MKEAVMRYSPCVELFYPETPFVDRLAKIKALGFQEFEFWTWWDKDVDAIAAAARKNGLKVAGCCTKFVSLVDPGEREDYLQGLRASIDAARVLECPILISQVGSERPGVPRGEQKQSLVDGLKAAAQLVEEAGIVLVFEPLNVLVDHPGYFLSYSDEAYEIWNAVGSPSIKILFDVYHQQITEGHLIANIEKYLEAIGHFHIADNPGRHEPGTGEINYANVLKRIAELGYSGSVGLEYAPLGDDESALMTSLALAHTKEDLQQ
jgi:hydroxypyruvate isomerase